MEKIQTSDSIQVGLSLAVVGGFMDAYSYIGRGGVFANAQTGNMLLFGINLYEQNWNNLLKYAMPVVCFALGILLADAIRFKMKTIKEKLHWRQLAILIELLFLVLVGFIPLNHNLIANSLTSLACGMQVESFRKIHGSASSTTMCIGNLRSGTENLALYLFGKKQEGLVRALLFFCVILTFVAGAVLGNYCVGHFGQYAIIIDGLLLLIPFALMFNQEVEEKLG